jgi:hypothetical protein
MMDADLRAVRDARLAWIIGGSLLIAFAVLTLAANSMAPIIHLPGWGIGLDVLWAAALLVFALGIRRAGSIVARQPLGVVALVLAAVLPFVSMAFWWVIPPDGMDQPVTLAIGQTFIAVSFAALLVATVVIARAGAVPHRVRWVPLIVLLVAAGVQVLAQSLAVSASSSGDGDLAALVSAISLTSSLAILLLGVLAIFFAPREPVRPPAAETLQVYPPA